MAKQLRLSASSIKTFCASKAKWAWKYCLWVEDEVNYWDALALGKLFEHWLMFGKDDYSILDNEEVFDMEKLMETYDALKHNAEWLEFERWTNDFKVEWELFGVPFIWYIDNFREDCIDDIKTSQYLSKEWWSSNHRSWMTYHEEYALQLRLYMLATWVKKAKIIEFEMTDEWKEKMINKYQPIVQEMKELFDKYNVK